VCAFAPVLGWGAFRCSSKFSIPPVIRTANRDRRRLDHPLRQGQVIRHNFLWTLVLLVYPIVISVACYLFFPGIAKL
jgi:hypothetical protein